MSSITDWSVGGCCCVLVGPWDVYWESECSGTPFIPRTASIYLDSPPRVDSGPEIGVTPASELEWRATIENRGNGADFQEKREADTVAPLDSGTELFYVYITTDEYGHSFNKKFHFVSDTGSFVELGTAGDIVFEWLGTDGAASTIGCVRFVTTANFAGVEVESAKLHFDDWTDLGVPDTATAILSIEVFQIYRKVAVVSDALVGHSVDIRVLDDSDMPITEDDPIFSHVLPNIAGGWQKLSQSFPSPVTDDDPTHEVNIWLDYTLELGTADGDPGDDVRLDELILQIHYLDASQFNASAWVKINSETKKVEWIVADDDWRQLEIDPTPIYAPVLPGFGLVQFTLGGSATFSSPVSLTDIIGQFCSYNKMMRWELWRTSAISGTVFYKHWKIGDLGGFEYREENPIAEYVAEFDPVYVATATSDEYWDYPRYTGYQGDAGGELYYNYIPDDHGANDDRPKTPFEDWFYPIGQATTQADRAIGIRYPHIMDLPATHGDLRHAASMLFTAITEVGIGRLQLEDFEKDGSHFYFPKVEDTSPLNIAVHIEQDAMYIGRKGVDSADDAGVYANPLSVHVDGADASGNGCIAIVTCTINNEFDSAATEMPDPAGTDYFWTKQQMYEGLVLDGQDWDVAQKELIWTITHDAFNPAPMKNPSHTMGTPVYDDDARDFYPHWFGARSLQELDADQPRNAVFTRRPFDQDEADTYATFGGAGDSSIYQWKLHHYTSQAEDFVFSTPLKYASQASGILTLSTTGLATVTMTALLGGDADGDVDILGNRTVTVIIEQSSGIERADYDPDSDTLTVKIDIGGGHDTVADFIEVVNDGGDFVLQSITFATDVIDEQTVTVDLVGGSDQLDIPDLDPKPYVWDSSDLFLYVFNFPMRVRRVLDNRMKAFTVGVSGGGEQTENAPGVWPTAWRISHDGAIISPLGVGTDPQSRDSSGPGSVGGTSLSSIKHSNAIPYCPEEKEV